MPTMIFRIAFRWRIEAVDPGTQRHFGKAGPGGEIIKGGCMPASARIRNTAPFVRYPMRRLEEWKAQHDLGMACSRPQGA